MLVIGAFLLTGALFCEHPAVATFMGGGGILCLATGYALTV